MARRLLCLRWEDFQIHGVLLPRSWSLRRQHGSIHAKCCGLWHSHTWIDIKQIVGGIDHINTLGEVSQNAEHFGWQMKSVITLPDCCTNRTSNLGHREPIRPRWQVIRTTRIIRWMNEWDPPKSTILCRPGLGWNNPSLFDITSWYLFIFFYFSWLIFFYLFECVN